jgi:non-ribosomal peptide synthetase component F
LAQIDDLVRRRRTESDYLRRPIAAALADWGPAAADRGGLGGLAGPRTDRDQGSTMAAMYLDALSFLEDERDAWRPFEALLDLSDEQLEQPVEAAHGWSGRQLMGHVAAWQEVALDVARELAVNETSPTAAQVSADWDERGGDVVNAEIDARWADRPLAEVRDEFRRIAGELRGYLTVVPESRWIKNAANQRTLAEETLDHYDDHQADLEAILAAVRE